MPQVPKVLKLPPAVLAELDHRLHSSKFSGYEEHAAWLQAAGHPVGKSALHVYATSNRQRIEAAQQAPPMALPLEDQVTGQRIDCLKVAASLRIAGVDTGLVQADADQLHSWAKRR